MQTDIQVIQHTQCWLESIIIELNFCPFAKREFINETIRYRVCNETDMESMLQTLASELQHLDNTKETETTLLIFQNNLDDFNDFLLLIDLSNQLLEELGYSAIYQLAHFHPDYCFDGVNEDDASNYTNRAPYPTLHLIREDSLEKAIAKHPNPDSIPDTNIKLAREMGVEKFKQLLKQCLHSR